MANITIRGRKYNLRMDVHAMEAIEREFGDLKEAMNAFKGRGGKSRKISVVKMMFRILANSGQRHAGQPEDVTGDEIDSCNLADLNTLAKTLDMAMEEAMHAETIGGNEADDEVHDEYGEQLEEMEKNV